MSIDVPEGADAGDVLEVLHPTSGEWIKVVVPEGSVTGTMFEVDLRSVNSNINTTGSQVIMTGGEGGDVSDFIRSSDEERGKKRTLRLKMQVRTLSLL